MAIAQEKRESRKMPSISEIAHNLNRLSAGHKIGDLQGIRKRIKKKTKKAGSTIFHDDTISAKWAFHYGGRKELQFNIGKEKEGLRYGIAFSLEPSQTLPKIDLLFPKIMRFNQFIRENPGFFKGFSMWHWQKRRSDIEPVAEIDEHLLKSDTFIFIGKLNTAEDIDYAEILKTFDLLLTPYIYVEKGENSGIVEAELPDSRGFLFSPGKGNLVHSRSFTSRQKYADLDIRHSLIVEKLASELIATYGEGNVRIEQPCYGKSIDVVLRQGADFIFYEVKTCGSAKGCIREALGQIMEYAYWPGKAHAKKIVIVGEPAIDAETDEYLNFIKTKFFLPLEYKSLDLGT